MARLMNKEAFYAALANPGAIGPATTEALMSTVGEYPYFHAGWMLYLKGLRNVGDIRFPQELRRGSIRVWDRSALFWLINGRPGAKEEPAAEPEKEEETTPAAPVEVGVKVVGLGEPVVADYFSDVSDELPDIVPSASSEYALEDGLEHLGRPDERYTFGDWLQYYTSAQAAAAAAQTTHRGDDLIDQFLRSGEERITPAAEPAEPRKAQRQVEKSERENDDILTETLAAIYVKQNHFDKAINIYRKLSLKNPEKSAYFAARISELEKQRNNINN